MVIWYVEKCEDNEMKFRNMLKIGFGNWFLVIGLFLMIGIDKYDSYKCGD